MALETFIVILIMLAVGICVFIGLHFMISSMSKQLKEDVTEQLATYDSLVKNKEIRLTGLRAQIDDLEKKRAEFDSLTQEEKIRYFAPLLPKRIDYCNQDFLKDYKLVKENMSFDTRSMLKEVIKSFEDAKTDEENEIICGILDKFSPETVFKISTFLPEEQKEIVSSVLEDREKEIFEEFEENFNIADFIYRLELEKEKTSKKIIVKTTSLQEDFSDISPNIVTEYDANICEGFTVLFRRKIYDYAIHYTEIT